MLPFTETPDNTPAFATSTVTDAMIEEMNRDLADVMRDEAAFTEAELRTMEEHERPARGAFQFTPEELATLAECRDARTAAVGRKAVAV